MSFFAPTIGIDLGSSNTLIYVSKRKTLINEPTVVVASSADRNLVRAVGTEALSMIGRTTDALTVIHPVRAGAVDDFDSTEVLARHFFRNSVGVSNLFKPKVLAAVPAGLPEVSRKALQEALTVAGARRKCVYLADSTLCAALGCGLPVYEPGGIMVVDIGGSTTNVAVLSLGGIVVSQMIPVGGDQMDEAIIAYIKKNSSMVIGARTAADLKIDMASALAPTDGRRVRIRGRDLFSGHAMTVEFTSAQAYDAVREPCAAILQAIKYVLERTPPELAADIMRDGVHLTGGASQLFALDQYIASNIRIPVLLAKEPESSVIHGLGFLIEDQTLFDAIVRKNNRKS